MKRSPTLLLLFGLLLFVTADAQVKKPAKKPVKKTSPQKKTPVKKSVLSTKSSVIREIRWTGTISMVEKYSGLVGISEKQIDLNFTNAFPTLDRNINTTDFNFTDDKGTGTITEHTEMRAEGDKGEKIEFGSCDCHGEGQSELHEVAIDLMDSVYFIHAISPPCKGGSGSDGHCAGTGLDITVHDYKFNSSPYHLSGRQTTDKDITIGKVLIVVTWDLRGCPPWNDPQSRLAKIEAKVKAAAEKFIKRVHDELCIKLKVVSGLRTAAQQDAEFAKGRTTPGIKITAKKPLGIPVTYAEAWESYHNYGLAIDVAIVKENGQIDFDTIIPENVAKIGKEEGFEWGGDWAPPKTDHPHFQMTFGQTIKQLKRKHATP